MGALDEIITRAKCCVEDGDRDAVGIIRECYDLEVSDWFKWELIKAVFNPGDLLDYEKEEQLVEYCIGELKGEVQDMVDDAVQAEEDLEEAENAYYDLGLDEEESVSNRERDVFENLAAVEVYNDNGHELYKFFHKDGEHSVTWDETQHKFVN